MTAGYNVRFNVVRILQDIDDVVGGASITGSVVYYGVMGRFEKKAVEQVFVEQGLETERVFTAQLIPGTLDIKERDELELCAPQDHREWGHRFRVVDVSPSDFNPRDPRNYLNLQLTRSVRAHERQ